MTLNHAITCTIVYTYLNRERHEQRFNISYLVLVVGRILMDTPCKVCQDHSSGKHYGIYACDGSVYRYI